MTYSLPMSPLAHGRLWRALIAVAFLLATAMPAVAAFHRPAAAAPSCADRHTVSEGMADCSGHATKALACGFVACVGLAIACPDRSVPVEGVALLISFPPAQFALMIGAALPPDPFPPRASRLA